MGNKILGKRSRSFYKGFNARQLSYLKQKFQSISNNGVLDANKCLTSYLMDKAFFEQFMKQADFQSSGNVDEYEFICVVSSICNMSIEELGRKLFTLCSPSSKAVKQKQLLIFTTMCLRFNAFVNSNQQPSQTDILKSNSIKFKKYDYDKNGSIDKEEFTSICLKDEDYKKWLYNMGLITKKQMEFQDSIYDLVDSDVGEEIDRHLQMDNPNIDRIKRGIQHRNQDDEFQVEEVAGQQCVIADKPWLGTIRKIKQGDLGYRINPNPPSQVLTLEHSFGYRSFDCRNNVKFDSKGNIIYHNAALGIVMTQNKSKKGHQTQWDQKFHNQHKDDISCLDVLDNYVVTGETGTKPMVIVWSTETFKSKFILTKQLANSVGNVCMAPSGRLLAVTCNDENHKLIVYNLLELQQIDKNLTSQKNGILLAGPLTKSVVFDIKFTCDQKIVVVATIKQLIFVAMQNKGKDLVNANRGIYNTFSSSISLCLLPLAIKLPTDKKDKQYMFSGMGNGSIYIWQNQQCVKALFGHNGSVSALCVRHDIKQKSLISGDKSGKIILWNQRLEIDRQIIIPKTNCPSNMIISLCEYRGRLVFGTKSSNIYLWTLGQSIDKIKCLVSGHCMGNVSALTIDKKHPYFYTGGQDQRLIKWEYRTSRNKVKEFKCDYAIKSIDCNPYNQIVIVGYSNGVIECFSEELERRNGLVYKGNKNPDLEVLSLVRFDHFGKYCAAAYNYREFKVGLFEVSEKELKLLSWVMLKDRVISLDLSKSKPTQSKYFRINTDKYDYQIYDISKPNGQKVDISRPEILRATWDTHTVAFSPQTQGLMTEGVSQTDISCCCRSHKFRNVFLIGDKYSKLKLFNYPSIKNRIFNKYQGHSNSITIAQFNQQQDYIISIGGQQKSILLWAYDSKQVENADYINLLEEDEDILTQTKTKNKKTKAMDDQFEAVQAEGEQALSVNQFKGQLKPPTDFLTLYNSKRDNQPPKQQLSIYHVFGIRNKYLKDQVRNQCKFSHDYKHILFPTACIGIKMNIQTKQQQIYLQHKQDIVSFAIDNTRTLMATGQMAQKNQLDPRRKILSVYVWDIQNNQVLQKLDGFHTVAVVLLSFSPSSKLLFTCGNDDKNSYAVYDWRSGIILFSGPVSNGKVNGICWKSETEFMTCGNDHVKFWNSSRGRLGKLNAKPYEAMICCVKSKDIYITGSAKGNLYNWLGTQSSKAIEAHRGKVQTLIQSGDFIYSGGDDGKILRWKIDRNGTISISDLFLDTKKDIMDSQKLQCKDDELSVLSIDFSQRNQMVVVTRGCYIAYVINNRSKLISQGHYNGELWGLTASQSKDIFMTAGDDGVVRLWDINQKREIRRVNFDNRVRALDLSNNEELLIADEKAVIYLYDQDLTYYDKYTGQPYEKNKGGLSAWVQDIKFDPTGKLAVYGTHAKSQILQFLRVQGRKIKLKNKFKGGSSALLSLDWSTDSNKLAINTQASELLFYTVDGKQISASALCNQPWATWTNKFGWPSKGIFQTPEYSDINTVCRHPSKRFMAVGYDDQTIRLFRYPCYIEKQLHKVYYGHSSHVTKIRFTRNFMVSVGGEDKTVIVWNIQGQKRAKQDEEEEDDGLDQLDQDIDIPISLKAKRQNNKPQEFFLAEDQGDQFTAVKPWLGAIKQPTYDYPKQTSDSPPSHLTLQHVQGYRSKDCRQNLFYVDTDTILYHAAAVVIYHNTDSNTQTLHTEHNDDILSIDYNKQQGMVLTGQIGAKPSVNLYVNGKLNYEFKAPIMKGVLAVAISPDGSLAACAGMDDDHCVALLDLRKMRVLTVQKGGKKVILKLGWINNNQFVTIGIRHYKYWTVDKGNLTSTEGKNANGNYVSLAIGNNIILTGGSNGSLYLWNRDRATQKKLQRKNDVQGQTQKTYISVVESINIQKDYVVVGSKDGFMLVLNKNLDIINIYALKDMLRSGQSLRSEHVSIRSIDILKNKLIIGTFGSEIFQFQTQPLERSNAKIISARCIMKAHYSPNNSWTNQVWGLCVFKNIVFTCSDDATLRCWSIPKRKLLGCVSLNVSVDKVELEKDKKTNDFCQASKGRCVGISPDGNYTIVGSKNGTVRVFATKTNDDSCSLSLTCMFRHAKQCISDIKFACNIVTIGSHDNAIYVYTFDNGILTRKYRPLQKHSSYITHLDISRDSCYLQSTCGAYQLLFWDLNTGKQLTAGATMLRDERWQTWTCNLGWPVQGIYPKCTDGTYIHSVDRSNYSINSTLFKNDSKSSYLLAAGNNSGKVCLYNYPCTIKSSKYVQGRGHSSHVTTIRWSEDDEHVLSVGGQDQCLMYWRVNKK